MTADQEHEEHEGHAPRVDSARVAAVEILWDVKSPASLRAGDLVQIDFEARIVTRWGMPP